MIDLDQMTPEERDKALEPKWPDTLDRKGDKNCPHEDHQAWVAVTKLKDTGHFMADIRVRCAHCGIPFEWIGLQAGLLSNRPTCDLTAQALRAPIKPLGSALLPGIPGFTVRMQ